LTCLSSNRSDESWTSRTRTSSYWATWAPPSVKARPEPGIFDKLCLNVLYYDGPLLCGFNVAIKGLMRPSSTLNCKHTVYYIYFTPMLRYAGKFYATRSYGDDHRASNLNRKLIGLIRCQTNAGNKSLLILGPIIYFELKLAQSWRTTLVTHYDHARSWKYSLMLKWKWRRPQKLKFGEMSVFPGWNLFAPNFVEKCFTVIRIG